MQSNRTPTRPASGTPGSQATPETPKVRVMIPMVAGFKVGSVVVRRPLAKKVGVTPKRMRLFRTLPKGS